LLHEMNDKTISGFVVRAHGRFFRVKARGRLLQCVVRDSVKAHAETKHSPVVVGDYVDLELLVDISPAQDDLPQKTHAVITSVHPRRTKFSRPKRGKKGLEQVVAANIDRMIIMTSVAQPQFKQGIIDRFLIAAEKGGLAPVLVINKIDLKHNLNLDRLVQIYDSIDVPVVITSATKKMGIDKLALFLKDRLSMVVGQSGVGKSSLLNSLEEGLNLKVGEVSRATQEGVHTTAAVQMFPLSFGGYVVDTPGLRYLGLWDLKKSDLRNHFTEIAQYSENCRFRNCMHKAEPDCAVKKAVENGEIFPERYESYLEIFDELQTKDY